METRALQVFLSVAETLNFSRSSENLHMSVSAVSRTVRRLEEELGQTLLARDKRSVSLTREGLSFREYARQALAEWHQVKRQLARDHALAGEIITSVSVLRPHTDEPFAVIPQNPEPAVTVLLDTLGILYRHEHAGFAKTAIIDLPDVDSIADWHRERRLVRRRLCFECCPEVRELRQVLLAARDPSGWTTAPNS